MRANRRSTRTASVAAPLIAVAAALVFASCHSGASGQLAPVVRALAPGETIGRVERASAGTSESSVRTLLSVECKNGRLTVRTNVDSITASDDCAEPMPQSTLDQMLGMPATVTYTGDRLVIESAASGVKLELPATNATVGVIDGAP